MNLLRYLSVLTLGLLLISCNDDDKITDDLPPEDAVNFTFKTLELTQIVDENGNTYISSATFVVDADVSSTAPEGYSKDVLIQVVKWEDGEEIEITKGAQFNLSGNGTGDAKSFNLNFDEIIDNQTELNLAANILEAGSLRKIKGQGIFVNVETEDEDLKVPYKVKQIEWDDVIDSNGDGFFTRRSVNFTLATEGTVEKELIGEIYLINDSNLDTALIAEIGQFTVKREGFSENDLSFSVNDADTLMRSGYEILMKFYEIDNPELVVFEQLYKAADMVRIGFEPTLYDNRKFTLANQPSFTWENEDPDGYYDLLHINFEVVANADFDYSDLENTGEEFGIKVPYASIYYKEINDPDFTNVVKLADTLMTSDPVEPQTLGIFLSELLPDSGIYDFEIHIVEPAENFFNSTEDVSVSVYTKDSIPALGNVKINKPPN